jgi:hypothetical protein
MSLLNNEIEDFEKNQKYSGPAKRIMEKIKPLKSHIDVAKRRWFWELLQNASDYNTLVSIELRLDQHNLTFKHNGNPFTYKDARNLIEPNSGKDELDENSEKDTVGQFGTGFLATHILSHLISVKGILELGEGTKFSKFNFNLNRSFPDNKGELMNSIENSIKELNIIQPHLEDYKPNINLDTEFSYDFKHSFEGENGFEIAKYGIENLKIILPYVLSFNHKIKNVTIIDNENNITKYLCENEGKLGQELNVFKILRTRNNIIEDECYIFTLEHQNTTVAFSAKKISKDEYSILDFSSEVPKLFCIYPFVGTEDFNFPIVVNSYEFDPKTERNGIELSNNDIKNRNCINNAVVAYEKLLSEIEKYKFNDIYKLCKINEANFSDNIINNWFKIFVFEKIKAHILNHKTVETETENIYLKDALIPYYNENKEEAVHIIYSLGCNLYKDKLPKDIHYLHWFNILNFKYFENQKLDFERLVKVTSQFKTLINLKETLNTTNLTGEDWLHKLIKTVIDFDNKPLLDKYAITPNQNDIFLIRKSLFIDNNIPESLKNVYNELTKNDYRDLLLDNRFKNIVNLIDEKDQKEIFNIAIEIDNAFREFNESKKGGVFLSAINTTFKWISENKIKDEDAKKYFPWFSQNKAQIVLDSFENDKMRENAFIIIQSDKMESLTKLAESSFTNEEILLLSNNVNKIKNILELLNGKVDDEDFANEITGLEGEQIVYNHLVKVYGTDSVIWSSKSGEPRFDFEVKNLDSTTKFFIDVKTTIRGIGNADSIPFFMRKSQWDFLDESTCLDKYYIARVFLGENKISFKFLKVNKTEL